MVQRHYPLFSAAVDYWALFVLGPQNKVWCFGLRLWQKVGIYNSYIKYLKIHCSSCGYRNHMLRRWWMTQKLGLKYNFRSLSWHIQIYIIYKASPTPWIYIQSFSVELCSIFLPSHSHTHWSTFLLKSNYNKTSPLLSSETKSSVSATTQQQNQDLSFNNVIFQLGMSHNSCPIN
jgi:hypothetical protein